ncbi:MAG: Na/Pi symporter [Myxococcales bacterium]|nr:Na/Pi symporter [Myxococcales bacterium]
MSKSASTSPVPTRPGASPAQGEQLWLRAAIALLLLFIFLVGIRGMGSGFKGLGKGLLEAFFLETSNPFVALVVGILGTTLVQSSSVTTSMIVAMVAAPANPLPIQNAIPMIMGANIGTTVTNTIVALGHIGRPDEFRRAYSAATCHDFFNFMAVAVLLPLEIATGFLEKTSGLMASMVGTGGGGKLPNPIKTATKAALEPITGAIEGITDDKQAASIILIAVSVAIIFLTLTGLVKVLRSLTASRLSVYVTRSLDSSAYAAMLIGVVITVMVQSSSITTSVLVPLAGAGLVTLEQVFPITLGANVGTTVTALLASMAAPPETAALAVQIALVHLLFNLVGIIGVYPLNPIRQIPLRAASWLAVTAVRSKRVALLYIVVLFYGLPAGLIAVSKLF